MRKYLFSRVLIFLPQSPLLHTLPSFLLHQSFKRATVHSHFSFCTCQLNTLPQSPLSPANPAKQTLTTRSPNGNSTHNFAEDRLSGRFPGTAPESPPFPLQPAATDKRASKTKRTYCYGLEPFLVQLRFRHPGGKDTGVERGRRVGMRGGGRKKKKKGEQNQNRAHTAVTRGELELLLRKPSSRVVDSHFRRHCSLAHGRTILVTGLVPASLSAS